MTKTDFAELKEKLGKFDDELAIKNQFKKEVTEYRYAVYPDADKDQIQTMLADCGCHGYLDAAFIGVKHQNTKDAAIISELIEIIQSQSEAIQNINNKSGIDIKMVEYETVWGDPNNVKQTLEITQKVREKHFTEICSTLSETTTRLQKLRDGKW